MGTPGSDECATALQKLLDIFHRLGLPVALNKLEDPSSLLVLLEFKIRLRGHRSLVIAAQVGGAERADQAVGGAQILQKEGAGGQAGPCGAGSSFGGNFLEEDV